MLSRLVTGGLLLTAEPSSILNIYIHVYIDIDIDISLTKSDIRPAKVLVYSALKVVNSSTSFRFVLVLHFVDIPLKVFSTNRPHIYSPQSVKSM